MSESLLGLGEVLHGSRQSDGATSVWCCWMKLAGGDHSGPTRNRRVRNSVLYDGCEEDATWVDQPPAQNRGKETVGTHMTWVQAGPVMQVPSPYRMERGARKQPAVWWYLAAILFASAQIA